MSSLDEPVARQRRGIERATFAPCWRDAVPGTGPSDCLYLVVPSLLLMKLKEKGEKLGHIACLWWTIPLVGWANNQAWNHAACLINPIRPTFSTPSDGVHMPSLISSSIDPFTS